ncbi:hypothetical protein FRC16_006232 [Serendipita sp. 398]|nr:hypothetical protein FRC16_006232 [Serendipita sp. 398]
MYSGNKIMLFRELVEFHPATSILSYWILASETTISVELNKSKQILFYFHMLSVSLAGAHALTTNTICLAAFGRIEGIVITTSMMVGNMTTGKEHGNSRRIPVFFPHIWNGMTMPFTGRQPKGILVSLFDPRLVVS